MKLRNYYFFLLSCLMIFALLSCENEELTDQKLNTESSLIDHDVNPFFRTAKIAELKSLKSFISELETNSENFSNGNPKNNKAFAVLEEEDINVYSEKGITTYTIPIVKGDHSVNTVSNLVVRFSDTEKPRAFIIDYKTTQEFLNQKSINPLTPFQGLATYEAIDYDGSLDDVHARSGCYSVTYTFCNWGGSTHAAGQECTPSYMWNETILFCPGPGGVYEEVIAAPDGPNGGGGSIPGGSGNIGNTSYPSISLQLQLKSMFGMNNLTPDIVAWIDNPNNAFQAFDVWNFANENTNAQGFVDIEAVDLMVDLIETMIENPTLTFGEAALENYRSDLTVNELNEYNWYETSSGTLVNQLMNCFDNIQNDLSSSATYSLTIYVEQPIPNSDAPNDNTNPGHTFITMSTNDPTNSNNNVTQTFGFYPANGVNPVIGNNTDDGMFVNNGSHNYHVSATMSLDNSTFFQVVNEVKTQGNLIPEYNLETNNCTDFGINIANLAGMNLPDTEGTWGIDIPLIGFKKLGSGSNPGALGQDIRAMANNSINVTVNTTSASNAPVSKGPCN